MSLILQVTLAGAVGTVRVDPTVGADTSKGANAPVAAAGRAFRSKHAFWEAMMAGKQLGIGGAGQGLPTPPRHPPIGRGATGTLCGKA
jgi:hypothetical protein